MTTYTQPTTTSLGYLGQITPTYISVAGTYTISWPPLAKGAKIGLIGGGGGGGGGGGSGTTYGGGGGAPGQYIEFIKLYSVPFNTISCTLGAGGSGGSAGAVSGSGGGGSPGGNSTCTFNVFLGGNGSTYTYTALGGNPGNGGGFTGGTGGIANNSSLPTAANNFIAYGGLSGGIGTNTGSGGGSEGQSYMQSYFGHGGPGGLRYPFYNSISWAGGAGSSGAILIQWF